MNSKEKLRSINPEFVEYYENIDSSDEFFTYTDRFLRKCIRINTLKMDESSLVAVLTERYRIEKIPFVDFGYYIDHTSPGNTPEHQLGYYFVQESVSMIPPMVLGPEPGETVLDMAAAPGGKTTQIAQYMKNKGCIIANDLKPKRGNILSANIQRMGVTNTVVTIKDGRYFKRMQNKFDRVLVDAPCSNTGLIRKNYRFLKEWSYSKVLKMSELQKELIMAGYKALKPGGVLVYSTCTLEPEENEEVVDHLLSRTDAETEKIRINIRAKKPFTEFGGKEYDSGVKNCLRIHPQDNDTEGFFVAKVRKS